MTPPLVIAAATSAGIAAVVAFELLIFKPWREEHWPYGIKHGLESEWKKRIQPRAIRAVWHGHTQPRLGDDELDDFRKHLGEERYDDADRMESEQLQEFEMHQKQNDTFRDQLIASIASDLAQNHGSATATEHHHTIVQRRDAMQAATAETLATTLSPSATTSTPSPSIAGSLVEAQTHGKVDNQTVFTAASQSRPGVALLSPASSSVEALDAVSQGSGCNSFETVSAVDIERDESQVEWMALERSPPSSTSGYLLSDEESWAGVSRTGSDLE